MENDTKVTGRDEKFNDGNIQLLALELERLLEKYKGILTWNDRLEAAGLVSLHYGRQLTAIDAMFTKVIPNHKEIQADPDLKDIAYRFMELANKYNPGPKGGQPFDVRSFQGASLNEMRLMVRSIVRSAIG